MGIGILTGIALCGSAAQAAASITATLSNQPIYVDGVQAPMTAYAIGGNNCVRLRDIGKAVDFGVAYDAATNSVHIDTGAHYQEESAAPAPSALTEESVYTAIRALRDRSTTKSIIATIYGKYFCSLCDNIMLINAH